MKKLLFVAAAAALGLSSCSDNTINQVTEKAKCPITINVYSQGQTRAFETTTFQSLQDRGFDLLVTVDDNQLISNRCMYFDNAWNYGEEEVYWPANLTAQVNFYGILDPDSDMSEIGTDGTCMVRTTGSNDVVAAYTTGTAGSATSGVVNLSFEHIFGQVKVSVKGQSEGYSYTLNSVSVELPQAVIYDFAEKKCLEPLQGVPYPYYESETEGLEFGTEVYVPVDDEAVILLPTVETTFTVKYSVTDNLGYSQDFTKFASFTPIAGTVNRLNLTLPYSNSPISINVEQLEDFSRTENETNTDAAEQ